MKAITSADNTLFKSLKELSAAKGRREQGLYLAEGPHLAEEALKAGADIRYVVVSAEAEDRYAPLLRSCESAGAQALSLPPRLFRTLADAETPQGVLVAVAAKALALEDADLSLGKLALVLERVQDPGNLGTMLRTALAVGADFAVLSDGCADPTSPKAVRASQGAVLHLRLLAASDGAAAAAALNGAGWHTACGHLHGTDFFHRERHEKYALVIGNEAAGVTPEAAAACSALYKLPMPGAAESLNAAVAAGIMLYDILREQRGL